MNCERHTFAQAKKACEDAGSRLCTYLELGCVAVLIACLEVSVGERMPVAAVYVDERYDSTQYSSIYTIYVDIDSLNY